MSRLFVTSRELDFISDITKELTKDVIGQKIFYYVVREDLTNVHDVYEEAPEKIFNPPIELDALVDWQPEEVRTNRFGSEEVAKIDIYIHARDLLDKDVVVRQGDFFSYGDLFFEITSLYTDLPLISNNINFDAFPNARYSKLISVFAGFGHT